MPLAPPFRLRASRLPSLHPEALLAVQSPVTRISVLIVLKSLHLNMLLELILLLDIQFTLGGCFHTIKYFRVYLWSFQAAPPISSDSCFSVLGTLAFGELKEAQRQSGSPAARLEGVEQAREYLQMPAPAAACSDTPFPEALAADFQGSRAL